MLSHPKGGGAVRDRGDGRGDSFQGGPECSLSSESGGPGRRYRQREQERTREKRNDPLAAELPEENAGTCFEKWTGSTDLVKTVAMPAMHSGD